MKGIADTGFIVAFGNKSDKFHYWALEIAQNLTEPLLTCEAVISEAAFHLGSSEYVLSLVDEGLLKIAFNAEKKIDRLKDLARKYNDRDPDFADLCLICMSEQYSKHVIITADKTDFMIYKKNGREVIPVLFP